MAMNTELFLRMARGMVWLECFTEMFVILDLEHELSFLFLSTLKKQELISRSKLKKTFKI